MSDIRRLAGYIQTYRGHLGTALVAMVLVTIANLMAPSYAGGLIDRLIATRDFGALNRAALVMLGLFGLRSVGQFVQLYATYYMSHRVTADLRQDLFARIQRWSLARFATWQSGDAIARSLQDTQLVQGELLGGVVDAASTTLMLGGIVAMLLWIDWQLSAVIALIIPAVLLLARAFGREIQGTATRAQEHVAGLAGLIREAFTGARVIRAFASEEREIGRFRQVNERTFRANLKIARMIAIQVPVTSFLTAFGIVVVLWVGGQRVTAGHLTAGALVAFLAYVALAIEPAQALVRHYAGLRQALGAFGRIRALLEEPEAPGDAPGAVPLPPIRGHVRFDRVSFAYEPGQWVLRDVSLEAAPGERLALVGTSGAGKTTLVNLLARFYDPTMGTVEIDGHDLRRVRVRSLRRQIGLVPQETILFRGTVRDNIAYARPDATLEEVVAAARVANAHDFITALPQGYETLLGDDGLQLSGGQRQRLAIARALLNDPRLLILDEATSALDSESEALIQEAIDRIARGRTTFIIAHRLSTVRNADRIVVLDQGTVVEEGRHDELMTRDGTYARLIRLQMLDVPAAERTAAPRP
ncbi:MAG: ABC transporter ATP-binding protein [Armatimonadota bacterium]|nr:ABC transporter ATP-binding protein [Armatimonadota bacterium]